MAEQTGEKLVCARFLNSRSRPTYTEFATQSSYDIKINSVVNKKTFILTITYNICV